MKSPAVAEESAAQLSMDLVVLREQVTVERRLGEWEVRARALDALQTVGLDREGAETVRVCLQHCQWLVRLLAVRFTASDDKTVPKLAGSLFADIFLVGLLAARIGYVLRWWPEYAHPGK